MRNASFYNPNNKDITEDSFAGLEPVKTIMYYDRPILYTCKNKDEELYLAMLVEEKGRSNTWLYIWVSDDRINALKANKLSLYEAFKEAENHKAYQITLDEENNPKIDTIEAINIPDKFLPDDDLYIGIYISNSDY